MQVHNRRVKCMLFGLPGLVLFFLVAMNGGATVPAVCFLVPFAGISTIVFVIGFVGYTLFDIMGFKPTGDFEPWTK